MVISERVSGTLHQELRHKGDSKKLVKKAKKALFSSGFSALVEKAKQQYPRVSVIHTVWDERGRSDRTELRGLPNSAGIIVEWDRHEGIRSTGRTRDVQTTFRAVVILANPFGGVSIEGEETESKPYGYWMGNPQEQKRVFRDAFLRPRIFEFTRPVERRIN